MSLTKSNIVSCFENNLESLKLLSCVISKLELAIYQCERVIKACYKALG